MRFAILLGIAVAVVAGVECSTDEDMITMLTILVAAALLGVVNPRRFLVSALAVGLVVPTIAVFSQATGWHPSYETASQAAEHGLKYAASLLFLIIPATLGAGVGAWIGKINDHTPTEIGT